MLRYADRFCNSADMSLRLQSQKKHKATERFIAENRVEHTLNPLWHVSEKVNIQTIKQFVENRENYLALQGLFAEVPIKLGHGDILCQTPQTDFQNQRFFSLNLKPHSGLFYQIQSLTGHPFFHHFKVGGNGAVGHSEPICQLGNRNITLSPDHQA